jgi:hypothetical protein
MKDDLEVPAGEGRGAFEDVVAPADEFDLGMLAQRLAQVRQAVAGAGHEDPHAVSVGEFFLHTHLLPPTERAPGAGWG